ncbi:MAG: prephenate dehydrogenase/arogenate dehydrogenase family protein [Patescibacteria group bacterium]|nr:prephenate dehydrogenase/arogenate dehydrogenase family protein [Patescibacteria group bacterium]
MQKPQTISIIGGNGQMGQKFANAFLANGYDVLTADIDTQLTNKEVAAKGDVVIITVPIHTTMDVIDEIVPVMKEDAMLTDFTSVKTLPMEKMKNANSTVTIVGGHPLFGPTTDFMHQHFILCHGQGENYVVWYEKFLTSLGLKVLEMTQEEHDKQMATIQCLTHFSTLSLGSALEKMDYDLEKGERISTPVYLMRLYGVGRILAQDSDLYADMQIYNPYAKEVIQMYKESVDELFQTVKDGDTQAFHDIFEKSKKYFGVVAERSMKVTDKLIKVLS